MCKSERIVIITDYSRKHIEMLWVPHNIALIVCGCIGKSMRYFWSGCVNQLNSLTLWMPRYQQHVNATLWGTCSSSVRIESSKFIITMGFHQVS